MLQSREVPMDASNEGIGGVVALGECEKIADVDEAHVDGGSGEMEPQTELPLLMHTRTRMLRSCFSRRFHGRGRCCTWSECGEELQHAACINR